MRKLLGAVTVLFFSLSLTFAADTISKAKVKSVDADKNTITVTVDDKDSTYNVQKDAKIWTTGKKKKGQPAPEVTLSGLSAVKEGATVTLTIEKKDDKDVCTNVKVEPAAKKKKKNQ